jgi:hypothetical protein
MFDDKVIVPDSLERLDKGEGLTVFLRLPYYRGLGLSMVEDIAISVDGHSYPREQLRLSLRGNTWSLSDMETEYGDRWNFGEKARLDVLTDDAVAMGEHRVKVSIRLRISYLPFVPTTTCEQVMVLS